jgi:hypothetical protein
MVVMLVLAVLAIAVARGGDGMIMVWCDMV